MISLVSIKHIGYAFSIPFLVVLFSICLSDFGDDWCSNFDKKIQFTVKNRAYKLWSTTLVASLQATKSRAVYTAKQNP